MKPLDTKPSIQTMQDDIVCAMSGADRLRLAMDMSDAARTLTLARLKQEHPNVPPRRLVRELLRTILAPGRIPTALR